MNAFSTTFRTMVKAADERGCGYEAQLESWYRFLVDPSPPESVALGPCAGHPSVTCAAPVGKDATVLKQRSDFLRPDSLVAVIMLTDENDCSIIDADQGFLAAQQDSSNPMNPGTPECDSNPNDRCCRNCLAGTPDGCQDQRAACTQRSQNFAAQSDPANLRCWDQKRRFGKDFLYPTQRYVNALTKPTICPSRLDLDPAGCPDANNDGVSDTVPNPLLQGSSPRDPSLVFLAGIVGVPWQDIATSTNRAEALHFKTATELGAKDPAGASTWDVILGDPAPADGSQPVPPRDGLMVESWLPRSGNDGQGQALRPAANAPAAAIELDAMPNGHEWNDVAKNDLEYSCIFELPAPVNCSTVTDGQHCDCQTTKPGDNNPICQDKSGNYGQTQHFAKAYPGLRELEVLKDFGERSIVASICSRNTDPKQADAQDYGYSPAVDAIVDRLKNALTNKCLPLTLTKVPDNSPGAAPGATKTPCAVIEATPITSSGQQCNAATRRTPADSRVIAPAKDVLQNEGVCDGSAKYACSQFLFCTLPEATGATSDKCHQVAPQLDPGEIGWCYVDPAVDSVTDPQYVQGDEAIVKSCPASQQRALNFIDKTRKTPAPGSTVLIACFGAQSDAVDVSMARGTGGRATAGPASDAGP
jgi:hypothetical protein